MNFKQVLKSGCFVFSVVWDQGKCSRYNWLWYDATTYLAYTDETSYENSLLVQQSGSLALSSMSHVMKSLTPNAKNIFLMLCKHQLENTDNSTYIGIKLFVFLCIQWSLTYPDTSVPRLTVQITEYPDK